MKLLLIVSIFLLAVSESRRLERKFIFDRIELIYFNPKYGERNVTLRKVSRDKLEVSMYVTIKRDAPPDDLQYEIQLYKLSENRYKSTALKYKRNYCDFLNREFQSFFQKDKMKNFIHSCPIKKGFYFIEGLSADMVTIPKFMDFPLWSYRLDASLFTSKENISLGQAYFSIREV